MVLVHCTSPNVCYQCLKFQVDSFHSFKVKDKRKKKSNRKLMKKKKK